MIIMKQGNNYTGFFGDTQPQNQQISIDVPCAGDEAKAVEFRPCVLFPVRVEARVEVTYLCVSDLEMVVGKR